MRVLRGGEKRNGPSAPRKNSRLTLGGRNKMNDMTPHIVTGSKGFPAEPAKWSVDTGAGIGAEFGFSGLPAGPLGTVPPSGISGAGGFAALDGDTGVF